MTIAYISAINNVWTKYSALKLHDNGETDLIKKNRHKFNKVYRPSKGGQCQVYVRIAVMLPPWSIYGSIMVNLGSRGIKKPTKICHTQICLHLNRIVGHWSNTTINTIFKSVPFVKKYQLIQ